ncbi:response regulator [Paenibacillus sp. FSL R7-0048]|jgi:two-component system response regulator YesN|uniref:response regulator transcription factor n=1 Tax=Paenibacillus TaxID=44249 RepID=UPI00096E0182|nr:response regulator [Paenibacillus odorifer]OMD61754.1 DNA-binding response regulator [Paenibacillus odorifer]OMD70295.1 DNA-binding response regulator [Paenibacillus odorifer]
MQMIIVDDEAHWVDNLAMTKPWHTLGIEQVHKAYSAREALQIIDTNPIDIVISDIQMPEMTGIELIERIRKRDKKIKCIILSGHSEFDYAKKALQHNAVDYLLKPPTDDEIIGAVKTAIEQLNTEWELISSLKRTQFTLRENLPLLRGQLLLDALQGHQFQAGEWERKLVTYDLPFHSGDCALMLVRMEEEFSHYNNNDQTLIEYAIINMAEEIMGEFMQVWGVKEEHGYLVFLLQLKEKGSDIGKETILEKLSLQLQYKVKQFLKGSLSIVITEWFQFPEKVSSRFRQATAYFRQIVGDEREFVMRVSEFEPSTTQGPLDALYTPPTLIHLLESGHWDAAQEKLLAVCAELDEKWSESWEHCMEAGFLITASFTNLAHRNGHTLANLAGDDLGWLQSGEAFSTIGKLRKWSLSILSKLKEGTSNEIKDIRSEYVKKIQDFTDKNLHLDVSLRVLADHVNLHPTHLSKIYKIETGEGISDYISRLRMDRACHKLKTTSKKVYEISMEIGYMDPAYFIKVFKRQFGVTPQEYRDNNK